MAEVFPARTEGELIAISLMLRQLYILAAKEAGVGQDGLTAWRDDLQAQVRASLQAMSAGDDEDISKAGRACLNMIEGVFATIT